MTASYDRLRIRRGAAHSRQRAIVAAPVPARRRLMAAGPAYFAHISRLPLFQSRRGGDGGYAIVLRATPLVLLHFAAPYFVRAGTGYALRYPIRGGLMARRAGGYLAFSARPVAYHHCELRIDVVGYHSRLGSGLLYRSTQARLHSLVCLGFMRRWRRLIASSPATASGS